MGAAAGLGCCVEVSEVPGRQADRAAGGGARVLGAVIAAVYGAGGLAFYL